MSDFRPGSLLRAARRQAGLSQAEFAKRAGVTQSVVSAYETAARQPSMQTLARLIAASGLELEVGLRRPESSQRRLGGPIGARVLERRLEVQQIAVRHGLTNVRVFGSVARGEETDTSDIDLLVDVAPGVGMLGLGRCQQELEELLHVSVDIVPARALKPGVASSVIADVVPL